MKNEILESLHRRIVKNFMDVLILRELRNSHPMSGYDVIGFIHEKFRILISSGTIYSLLYSMERDGLIEGRWAKRKRVYCLTDEGKETIENIINANDLIRNFMEKLLSK